MTLLLAAFGAIVAALIEATVVGYLRVGESQPHLVFVLAVIVTVVGGFDRGLVWAFVGGLLAASCLAFDRSCQSSRPCY
jgi:hypothetical protein